MSAGPRPPMPPGGGAERWADVPLEEIDLPSFLGRAPTSREERDRQRAAELAVAESARRRARRRATARRALVGTAVVLVVVASGFALRDNPAVRSSIDDLAAGRLPGETTTSAAPPTTEAER